MIKHKAIAIPVSFVDDMPRFLTVRDRRFKEWIFITGGCRKSEVSSPIRCAIRELEEETRATVCIKHGTYSYFQFEVPENLNANITLIYHVYVIPFNINIESQSLITASFYFEKSKSDFRKSKRLYIQRTHDENDMLNFDTLDSFNMKDRWSLITDNIINNPEFYRCLTSLNRDKF